jgi:hypothetical protein
VLAEGLAHAMLVDTTASTESAAAGFARVAPGEPERSFLLSKLLGPPPGQGSRMPLGQEPLEAAEIEQVRNWILQGANR